MSGIDEPMVSRRGAGAARMTGIGGPVVSRKDAKAQRSGARPPWQGLFASWRLCVPNPARSAAASQEQG